MEMSSGWFTPLNIDTCENFVMPVSSTKRRWASAALKVEKKFYF